MTKLQMHVDCKTKAAVSADVNLSQMYQCVRIYRLISNKKFVNEKLHFKLLMSCSVRILV